MKVLVLGAGTVGSVYGGLMTKAGHDVLLVAGREHANAIAENGLRLYELMSGRSEVIRVAAASELPERERFDLVLVTVRNDQLLRAAQDLAPTLEESGYAMLFQNGLDGVGVFAGVVGREKVTMGFGQVGGSRQPGVVSYYIAPDEYTVIGELDGKVTARIQQAKMLFDSAGFRARIIPNIESWVVTHTALVLSMALVVLNKADGWNSFGESPEDLRLAVRGMKECVRILKAKGIKFTREASLTHLLPNWLLAKLLEVKVVKGLSPEVRQHVWKHAVDGAVEWRRIQQQLLKMAEESHISSEILSKL